MDNPGVWNISMFGKRLSVISFVIFCLIKAHCRGSWKSYRKQFLDTVFMPYYLLITRWRNLENTRFRHCRCFHFIIFYYTYYLSLPCTRTLGMNQEHFIHAKTTPIRHRNRQRKTLCVYFLKYSISRLWKGGKPVSSRYDMAIIVYRFFSLGYRAWNSAITTQF